MPLNRVLPHWGRDRGGAEIGDFPPEMIKIEGFGQNIDTAIAFIDLIGLIRCGKDNGHAPCLEDINELVDLLAEQLDIEDRSIEATTADNQMGIMNGRRRSKDKRAVALEIITNLTGKDVVIFNDQHTFARDIVGLFFIDEGAHAAPEVSRAASMLDSSTIRRSVSVGFSKRRIVLKMAGTVQLS